MDTAKSSIPTTSRLDLGNGKYRYSRNGEVIIEASKVRYTHATSYLSNDGSFESYHKSEAAALKASHKYCPRIGTAAIEEEVAA